MLTQKKESKSSVVKFRPTH